MGENRRRVFLPVTLPAPVCSTFLLGLDRTPEPARALGIATGCGKAREQRQAVQDELRVAELVRETKRFQRGRDRARHVAELVGEIGNVVERARLHPRESDLLAPCRARPEELERPLDVALAVLDEAQLPEEVEIPRTGSRRPGAEKALLEVGTRPREFAAVERDVDSR